MKIITLASFKGGVGKTTLAINLANYLFFQKKKVLIADFDPNNNTTDYYFNQEFNSEIMAKNTYSFLTKREPLEECIFKSNLFCDCLPSTMSLHRAGLELSGNPASLLSVRKQFQKLSYDFIIIDTPPSISFEMRAGLFAADIVVTPVSPSRWIFQSVSMLKDEINNVYEATDFKPELIAVPSMVTKTDLEKVQVLSETVRMTDNFISRAMLVKRCSDLGTELKQNSKSEIEFSNLAREII